MVKIHLHLGEKLFAISIDHTGEYHFSRKLIG